MSVRRRTGAVVLGLLVALATMLGAACLCTHGYAMQPRTVAVSSITYETPGGHARDHACLSPGHDQCGGASTAVTPTTGPGPHPQPFSPPVRLDARPASPSTTFTTYAMSPRAPDLHVLQVLRT
ncbi:hypothetical protein ABT173_32390 [Streptomyces sp. NPDC001795]